MRKQVPTSQPLYGGRWATAPMQHSCYEQTQAVPHRSRSAALPAGREMLTLLFGISIIVFVWHAVVMLMDYPAWLLPGPLDLLRRMHQAWIDGTLYQHTLPTLIAPYIASVQAISIIAIAPLIITWFGYSSDILRNMVVAAIVVFFPIFSSTLAGIRHIPSELREVGSVEGANWYQ
jgi:putative hydroxymethylpyrimidine transport system permease protein